MSARHRHDREVRFQHMHGLTVVAETFACSGCDEVSYQSIGVDPCPECLSPDELRALAHAGAAS